MQARRDITADMQARREIINQSLVEVQGRINTISSRSLSTLANDAGARAAARIDPQTIIFSLDRVARIRIAIDEEARVRAKKKENDRFQVTTTVREYESILNIIARINQQGFTIVNQQNQGLGLETNHDQELEIELNQASSIDELG